MGTERLPSLVIADDSTRTWRFEIDQDLRMALGIPATWKGVAIHRAINVVRPTAGDNAEIAFYTGGELGTTYEHSFKLETSGVLNLKSYNSGAMTTAISVAPTGAVSINGYTILTGTTTFDLPNIASGANSTFTITVTGCSTTNDPPVILGFGSNPTPGLIWEARVTGADTVTVRATNVTASGINEPSRTYRATVFQY